MLTSIFKRPQVFINYRRQDSSGHAGRLYDDLVDAFGKMSVTMDVDKIQGGEKYFKVIEHAIISADVLLVLIGISWCVVLDEKGRRRLDDPDDLLKKEILLAFESKKNVIPILIQGAKMPRKADLPAELAALSDLHALEISDSRWSYDVGRLINRIKELHQSIKRSKKWVSTIVISICVLSVVTLLLWKSFFSSPDTNLATKDISEDTSVNSPATAGDSSKVAENSVVSKPVDIVGAGFTADAFGQYVPALRFREWKPQFVVLHNTGIPTFAQWQNQSAKIRLDNLAKHLGQNLQWSKGPHLFVDDDSIWVFNDLDKPGIHSPSWNQISWGIEMVGDYSKEPLNKKVEENTVRAIATLLRRLKLPADSIRFHSEDPKVKGKICPGTNVNKQQIIKSVAALLR
jgi:hypothetical protein